MERRKTIIIGMTGHLATDQRMRRIGHTLCDMGFDVQVFYRYYFKFEPKDITGQYAFRAIALKSLFRSGVLFYAWYNLILFFRILLRRCDYLYAVDSDTLPAFVALSFIKNKPLLFDSHEYFAEVPELQRSRLKKKIWHSVTRAGITRSKYRITVSESLAHELGKRYGKPFVAVRNVPAKQQRKQTAPLDKPTILYQGALNEGRELEMLIASMKHLPEFDCVIAGEGDLSHTLREQADGSNNIQFAGLISPEALAELTPKCFAGYNLLSGNSLSYRYSLSNKYFDYMQAGIPSLSSALPEYECLNARYKCGECIANTQEALVETLSRWRRDTQGYELLKENAIIAAGVLNWENEELVLKKLLENA